MQAQYAYDGFAGCALFAYLDGDFGVGQVCRYIYQAMDGVDGTWDRFTAPGDNSDGIVQGQSQGTPTHLARRRPFTSSSTTATRI